MFHKRLPPSHISKLTQLLSIKGDPFYAEKRRNINNIKISLNPQNEYHLTFNTFYKNKKGINSSKSQNFKAKHTHINQNKLPTITTTYNDEFFISDEDKKEIFNKLKTKRRFYSKECTISNENEGYKDKGNSLFVRFAFYDDVKKLKEKKRILKKMHRKSHQQIKVNNMEMFWGNREKLKGKESEKCKMEGVDIGEKMKGIIWKMKGEVGKCKDIKEECKGIYEEIIRNEKGDGRRGSCSNSGVNGNKNWNWKERRVSRRDIYNSGDNERGLYIKKVNK